MKLEILFKNARGISFEIEDDSIFYTDREYIVYLNDKEVLTTNKTVNSIFGLKPETEYNIYISDGVQKSELLCFKTDYEFVTLNVLDFGAKGDGITDDTTFIQAAIMACPKNGRVLIPKGIYSVTSLFLKSDINIELSKGAVISAQTDRSKFPIFKGLIESYDENSEYNLGTWEGNPLPMFTGIITGVNAANINIYGEGIIDGNADFTNWWSNPKEMAGAFRPRLLFLNSCSDVNVIGLSFRNSPAWNIHPYFSKNLKFIDLKVENPQDSPNTDGLDPESCENVLIEGVYFSLGDDCIAVKSGKIYMGAKYKTPSKNIHVKQCLMQNGHGAVTIGSEMAGGVLDLYVEKCRFINTDRGLRIKTRRGRGKAAIADNIVFENIFMDNVCTPFVINCFYFCDPDGHTEYVRSKEAYPIDERTPRLKRFIFKNIECQGCHVAASYFYGLPESRIEEITMENVSFSFAEAARTDVPAMMDGIEPLSKMGIYVNNVNRIRLKGVSINGQKGEKIILKNVDEKEINLS